MNKNKKFRVKVNRKRKKDKEVKLTDPQKKLMEWYSKNNVKIGI